MPQNADSYWQLFLDLFVVKQLEMHFGVKFRPIPKNCPAESFSADFILTGNVLVGPEQQQTEPSVYQ